MVTLTPTTVDPRGGETSESTSSNSVTISSTVVVPTSSPLAS
jgi:hypothetical protein